MTTLEKISKQFNERIGRKESNFFTPKGWMQQYQNVMERLWNNLEQQKEKKGQYSLLLSSMDMLYAQESIGYAIDLIQALLNIDEEEQNA